MFGPDFLVITTQILTRRRNSLADFDEIWQAGLPSTALEIDCYRPIHCLATGETPQK